MIRGPKSLSFLISGVLLWAGTLCTPLSLLRQLAASSSAIATSSWWVVSHPHPRGDIFGLPPAAQTFIEAASKHIPMWIFQGMAHNGSGPRVAEELVREKADEGELRCLPYSGQQECKYEAKDVRRTRGRASCGYSVVTVPPAWMEARWLCIRHLGAQLLCFLGGDCDRDESQREWKRRFRWRRRKRLRECCGPMTCVAQSDLRRSALWSNGYGKESHGTAPWQETVWSSVRFKGNLEIVKPQPSQGIASSEFPATLAGQSTYSCNAGGVDLIRASSLM
ncbi:hypothetical protein HD554DRAFT_2277480 [Boletus coccyginus]|nr:hypothetical protein HD554DRAFT_2277480 [Boletus coccyginus]